VDRVTIVQRYEEFDGVTLPTVIVQRLPQFETVIRITKTTFDGVPDDVFVAPTARGANDER
jgi:hypothetical protein